MQLGAPVPVPYDKFNISLLFDVLNVFAISLLQKHDIMHCYCNVATFLYTERQNSSLRCTSNELIMYIGFA